MSRIWSDLRAGTGRLACMAGILACSLVDDSRRPAREGQTATIAGERPLPGQPAPPAVTRSAIDVQMGSEPGITRSKEASAPPRVAWRFQTAAPTCGAPAATEQGGVYVTSVEGYVHALGPDGGLRWSRSLIGVPLGAPAVDRAGSVYVATSARRLYAVRPDGRLRWVHSTPVRVATAPVWSASGVVYYAGRNHHLYALASWGRPLWNRDLGGAVTTGLAMAGGLLTVGTAVPELSLFRGAASRSRIALSGELRQPALSGHGHWYVVMAGQLLALDIHGESGDWQRGARHAALSLDAEWLVIELERELMWLSPHTGEELHRIGLPDDPSDAPALSNAGVVMVPLVSGDLVVARPDASALARVAVASGPLWRPIWNEHTQQLIVGAGSGAVMSIDLRGWQRTHSRAPQPEASPQRAGKGFSPPLAVPAGDVETKLTRARGGGA